VGSYVGLSKLLVVAFPVFLLAGLRFAIAAVLMLGWLRKPADEAPLDAHSRWLLFLESFLGNFRSPSACCSACNRARPWWLASSWPPSRRRWPC
jgi:drug/metabolite transporter (DMT)-like permease